MKKRNGSLISGLQAEVNISDIHCRLNRIYDWGERAHKTRYSVSELAKSCNVTPRTLERFFVAAFHDTPHGWLNRLRLHRAPELLRGGCNVNETAYELGYKDRSHFSREFKTHYGSCPKAHVKTAPRKSGPGPNVASAYEKAPNLPEYCDRGRYRPDV
jgi:AraC-like DNA-binding protein